MRAPPVVLLLLLVLADPASAQEIRLTLDKIRQTGAVSLGFRETAAPFSFSDKEGKPAGYSVDLCTRGVGAVRDALRLPELRVAWVPVTPATRIPSLVKGTIDLECGATTITFGRMEQVAFSHMTFVDGGSLLATAASNIASVKDLGGKRVGVIPNTTTEKALAEALRRTSITAQVIPVSDRPEGLRELEGGRLDALASDRLLLAGALSTAKDPGRLRLSGELFSYEPYGLMLRRGDNAFQVQVNRALSDLYRAGQIAPIYERWFGSFAAASPLMQALYLLHSWPE
jgi:ABC-type amino acid transport substrate-binding protein